jgi:hypothetical protein
LKCIKGGEKMEKNKKGQNINPNDRFTSGGGAVRPAGSPSRYVKQNQSKKSIVKKKK